MRAEIARIREAASGVEIARTTTSVPRELEFGFTPSLILRILPRLALIRTP
jgi:hypothetical protein